MTHFFLIERFSKPMKFFLGYLHETIDCTILRLIKFLCPLSSPLGDCWGHFRKTLRIRADTAFECLNEIPLADPVHGNYLWSHGAKGSTLERIINVPHKTAIKLCQKLRAC